MKKPEEKPTERHSVSTPHIKKDLCRGIRKNNEKITNLIYDTYAKRMLQFGQRFSNRINVEDCVQEVFLDLLVKARTFESVRARERYLFQCVKNKIRKHTRNEFAEIPESYLEVLGDCKLPMLEIPDEPDQPRYSEEIFQHLEEVLASLGDKEREAVELRFFHRYSLKQISIKLGLGEPYTKTLFYRALHKMRQKYRVILGK